MASLLHAGASRQCSLLANPAEKEQIVKAYVEIATAKPVPRQTPVRPQDKNAEAEKKQD